MYEACVQQMAGAMVAAGRGASPVRNGEREADVLHQGVYPAEGDDRWVAISVPDAHAWSRLVEEIGSGDWPSARELLRMDEAARRPLDSRLADWTRGQERYALMRRLQSVGVPAGVVQDASDLVDRDPQLGQRGFLRVIENPVLGAFGHQTTPFRLSRTPDVMTTAPRLGQHTEAIVRELCGLPADTFEELQLSGLFE
jgi:crotonobetainyl-CoA:carnitine CoA-transferase CaiB-like acyl-CoA transferase